MLSNGEVTLGQPEIPESMRAVRLAAWQAEPELVEIATPVPGPGEVLIAVDAAGLCHSDLHIMEWPAGTVPWELPFTLGHENAGTVVALGPKTSGIAEGDRVLVHARWGCGHCWHCLQGAENRCPHSIELFGGQGGGAGRDGGLADYMVVPSVRYLVPLGDLDPLQAAPLTDAALTPYHAIKPWSEQLRPNGCAVVIGVGGIGHMAVQLLRALSAVRIVAVDLREDSLELARRAGAHAAVPGRDLTAAELRAETGAGGATLVLDCVATDATLALAAGVVAPGGAISYIGRGGGTLPVSLGALPPECSVTIPTWGTLAELVEVVALARAGEVHTEIERHPLDKAVEGYRRLRRGEVIGRAVVSPSA
jgi:propanol-preferring alcohol dehydrogenase